MRSLYILHILHILNTETYLFRTACGAQECRAHMTDNAFWEVPIFCVQQILPRDGMHAIDLGAIIRLILAILRAIIRLILAILRRFWVCVELILNMEGLAAKKLEERMRWCLARREGPDGQW